MEQYKRLLQEILDKGTHKPAARENMPGTTSLFGYQFRHDLKNGFPLLTTKKINFKNIIVELLWFLRGDTNIKYLLDHNVNIWNEDAYQYFTKRFPEIAPHKTLEQFIGDAKLGIVIDNYRFGDCGHQYGKVWRKWEKYHGHYEEIDQIANLINSLTNNPEGRRHILTAIDPTHDTDLALYWCHVLAQFNCRPLTKLERKQLWEKNKNRTFKSEHNSVSSISIESYNEYFDSVMKADDIPKYYLDCHMYQRSADVFLGVPYNIASYALLTELLCILCNLIPGEMIYSYGDVHIYDNHIDAVKEQLERTPTLLPKLNMIFEGNDLAYIKMKKDFSMIEPKDIYVTDYQPQKSIKAELSTGLKK